jgi:hypothetical protein
MKAKIIHQETLPNNRILSRSRNLRILSRLSFEGQLTLEQHLHTK